MQQQIAFQAQSDCDRLLKSLNGGWNHPRVKDWLKRVGQHYQQRPYRPGEALPGFVYVSLAKFLDLRLRCERLLQLLKWGWDCTTVKRIEKKYGCYAQLPLKGYQELYEALDSAWLIESGGF